MYNVQSCRFYSCDYTRKKLWKEKILQVSLNYEYILCYDNKYFESNENR